MQTLRRVAVKIMKGKKLRKIPNGKENVKREIGLLRRLQHPNIVELIEVLYNDAKEKMYVVMEFCCGELQEFVEKSPNRKLGADQARYFFDQLISGLLYLHSKSVVHRDIKPGNLLISVDGTLKISDFGVADCLSIYNNSMDCHSTAGSPAFQAPEIATGKDSFDGTKIDVWAAGVTLFFFVTGKYPFSGGNVFNLFENIAKGLFDLPEVDPLLQDLLTKMLCKDPTERISVYQISQHPWLRISIPRQIYLDSLIQHRHHSTSLIPYLDYVYGDQDDAPLKIENILDSEEAPKSKKLCCIL